MSFWYDAKKKEYASDGKNGWTKAYCDKLFNSLKEKTQNGLKEIKDLFKTHIDGEKNRHDADHIDYSNSETVKEKISSLDSDITNEISRSKLETGDLSGLKTTVKSSIVSSVNEIHDYAVNKVYNADISKVGSGNNVLYINMDGITDYSQLSDKAIAVYTSAYQCTFSSPDNIYININGLGNKALRRPITGDYADYDSKQYYTDKFCRGEIGRYQTLIVSYNGNQFVLLNVAVPPKATQDISAGSNDDTSFVTPKSVAKVTDGLSGRINVLDSLKANKQSGFGGFEGGRGASVGSSDGSATGENSSAANGSASGSGASAVSGGASGHNAQTTNGFSGGNSTYAAWGAAVGHYAKAGDGFSGGKNAQVKNNGDNQYIDAIQLGTGTNSTSKTMQVYNKRIVEADGSLTDVGRLSMLDTVNKGSIVEAINELLVDEYNGAPYAKLVNNVDYGAVVSVNCANRTLTGEIKMGDSYIELPYTKTTISLNEVQLRPYTLTEEPQLGDLVVLRVYIHVNFADNETYAYFGIESENVPNVAVSHEGISFCAMNVDLNFNSNGIDAEIGSVMDARISGWDVLPYYFDSLK